MDTTYKALHGETHQSFSGRLFLIPQTFSFS